jgi:hypothetical protein
LVSIFLLAAFAVSACAPKPEQNPEAVAKILVERLNARDVDATLALFAEDAVVNTSDTAPTSYTGAAEIRGWLEEMAGANLQIKAEHAEVEGDTAVERESLSMDPWKGIGITSLDGVRKIKVLGGRIQSLEFSLIETSKSDLQAATLKATRPAYANIAYSQE